LSEPSTHTRERCLVSEESLGASWQHNHIKLLVEFDLSTARWICKPCVQNLLEYEDHSFQNAAKEDLKLSSDDDAKKLEKKQREIFKPLTKWWRKLLGDASGVETVRVSNRLASTPCVVVSSKYVISTIRPQFSFRDPFWDP
jgi:HSP90 family molecular chaperone